MHREKVRKSLQTKDNWDKLSRKCDMSLSVMALEKPVLCGESDERQETRRELTSVVQHDLL